MADGTRINAALAVVGALVLAACAPGTSPSSAPAASPLPVGAASIALVGDTPVLEPAALGDGHYSFGLPATYFVADGLQHAYVVGFAEARGDQEVFHVTSSDGQSWEVDGNPPFEQLGLELSAPGPIPGSVIQTADGTWVMYLWGIPAPQENGAVIWRATSASPGGPWIAAHEPVLELGEPGAWDDMGMDFPAVVPVDDGYLMLYGAVGHAHPETSSIGLATSPDGVTWTREPDPVLTADSCGGDAQYAALPRVVATDDGFQLLFDQERETFLATSPDGHGWTCAGSQPLLTGTDVPGGQGIHTFAAANVDGQVMILIESLLEGSSELWLGELQTGE